MMRCVILDFLSDPMGGLLTSARAALNRWRRFDPDSRIVVLELNGSVSSGVESPEAFEWVNVHRPGGLSGWRRMLWQNRYLPGLMRDYEASVYVTLSHYLPWTLPDGIATVVGVSNLAPFSDEAYRAEIHWAKKLRLRLLRKSIVAATKRAGQVIALSETCREVLVARGVAIEKISVIPNGVAVHSVVENGGASPWEREAFILCVSHFYRYKNYECLVRGYALLPEEQKRRYRLILVGKPYDPSYFEEIRHLVDRLNLAERVRLVDGLYGDKLAACYRGCALFVFPSLVENSPITLLEAMAHGAPVVASDVSAMREFGGEAVAYFDPRNEEALANVMGHLLEDATALEKLQQLGMLRAQEYTWDGFTEKLVQLCQRAAV